MTSSRALGLTLLLLGLTLAAEARAQAGRVALVIGNAEYKAAPLPQALHDAQAITSALQQIGFDVHSASNVSLLALNEAIDGFIDRIPADGVALVFYAGHGLQIDGENFLIPVDFAAQNPSDVKYEAFSAKSLQERIENQYARLNVIILDACHENPFPATQAPRGLSVMYGGHGTFFAYSSSAGSAAVDNPGQENGLFTQVLLNYLQRPGLELDDVFDRTSREVMQLSDGRQRPWSQSNFFGDFYFVDREAAPRATSVPAIVAVRRESGGDEVVVSQQGRADYASITEAIEAVRPGTRILVRPGTYVESLLLDKHVEIIGDGARDQIVVESRDGNVVLMQTDQAVVRGLTLRGRAGSSGKKQYTVKIPQGRLLLEDCDITSDSLAAVAITGPDTNPVLRGCKIHDVAAGGGVFALEGARGALIDCEISANAFAGVEIKGGAELLLQRCKIHSGQKSGIYFNDDAGGTIEDCEIYGNALAGIEIKGQANPIVRRCLFRDGETSGAFINDGGQGRFEDCEFRGHAYSGVEIKEKADPVLLRCRIHGGGQSGLYIHSQGQGRIESSEIFDNTFAGVRISDESSPVFTSTKIYGSKEGGVFVSDNGNGIFEDCEIYGNKLAGVEIKSGSNPVFRNCKIHSGQGSGVFFNENSRGVLEGCEIYGNALAGVQIKEDSDPILRRCTLRDGKTSGLFINDNGRGRIEDSEIVGNAFAGVEIKDGGDPVLRRTQIRNGQQSGVYVHTGGKGLFENCQISANGHAGVRIKVAGDPVFRNCEVTGNEYEAFWVSEAGRGTVESCDLRHNQRGAWDIDGTSTVLMDNNTE